MPQSDVRGKISLGTKRLDPLGPDASLEPRDLFREQDRLSARLSFLSRTSGREESRGEQQDEIPRKEAHGKVSEAYEKPRPRRKAAYRL